MEQAIPETRRYSIEEYLRLENEAVEKHEFYYGEIIAMAGGSAQHALITANFIAAIHSRLKEKPCRAYSGDLRLRVPRTPLYVYPDLSVICGPLEYDEMDQTHQTVTNPKLVVEVLSPTTLLRDRNEKFEHYLQMKSLEEYIMVSQKEARIDSFFRQPGATWLLTPSLGIDVVARIRSLEIDLPLTEIYAGVEFPPAVIEDKPRAL